MTRAITYTLFLEEPCLLTAPGGDPNTESSLSYIPGGALRGALAARYVREHSADKTFTDLFLNGKVRYLNAYPLLGDVRALPGRRSWATRKDVGQGEEPRLKDAPQRKERTCEGLQPAPKEAQELPEPDKVVYDRTVEAQQICVESGIPKGVEPSFVIVNGDGVQAVKVEYEIAVHTARNRAMGRAIEGDDESALFRYRALARGQAFGGVILLDDDAMAEKLTALLGDRLLLGGSHMAGYGLMGVGDKKQHEAWREMAGALDQVGAGDSFIIMLTSDAILRDPVTGGPTSDICAFLPGQADDYEIKASFAATGWVGGFNKQWGLPIAQQWAVWMGSTWLIRATKGIDSAGLAPLERLGIGARTAEGFGRLVIAPPWPMTTGFVMKKGDALVSTAPTGANGTQSDKAAQDILMRMNERVARAEMDRYLVAAVNNMAKQNVRGHLSRSQLGRLQVRIRQAANDNNLPGFVRYLEGTRQRKSADDQFRKFAVGGKNFRDELHRLAGTPQSIWVEFLPTVEEEVDGRKEKRVEWTPPKIGLDSDAFDYRSAELARDYTIRYIANLCRQLSKQEGES